eukprot:2511904-Amphidinium_carterae.1
MSQLGLNGGDEESQRQQRALRSHSFGCQIGESSGDAMPPKHKLSLPRASLVATEIQAQIAEFDAETKKARTPRVSSRGPHEGDHQGLERFLNLWHRVTGSKAE